MITGDASLLVEKYLEHCVSASLFIVVLFAKGFRERVGLLRHFHMGNWLHGQGVLFNSLVSVRVVGCDDGFDSPLVDGLDNGG